LQALIDIGARTWQAPPAEVYLVAEVYAWVSQRGGLMGIGGRRVMGLGLPLMQALTVSQLRAVLAHEFGHFCGRDTALGPWIYKTRAAIGRTLQEVASRSSWLAKPFEWYGTVFMRITHALSRHQEYIADRIAADVAGAQALGEGLKRLHGADLAFSSFWRSEMSPAIDNGFRPPLAQGFQQFLSSPLVRGPVEAAIQRELDAGKPDPYDTHPPLSLRLAAIARLPQGSPAETEPAAIALLDGVPQLEDRLLSHAISRGAAELRPISWESIPEQVWLPVWAERAGEHAATLRGLTPATLPCSAGAKRRLAVRLKLESDDAAVSEEQEQLAASVVGSALCVLLCTREWEISAPPGATVELKKDGIIIRPFELMGQLESGDLSMQEWKRQCDSSATADLDLGELPKK
jgi:heat shock protein HtpX